MFFLFSFFFMKLHHKIDEFMIQIFLWLTMHFIGVCFFQLSLNFEISIESTVMKRKTIDKIGQNLGKL